MMWASLDTWIVIAGVLCAMSCGLLGNFLVLRKMSMMGDAISHAVLPGLAIAFLLTGSRSSVPMFVGAALVGVLTAVFTEWVRGFGHVEEGAAMGVVFTALFAFGLILIVQAADSVDLDPGCVLYGAIEMTPLDVVRVGGWWIPRAVVTLAIVFAVDLLFVLVFYKELKISSFDAGLATTVGINARLMHYLLMTLVAVTTVASFESVGSILVVAMLVVPAATAHLLTERLPTMLVVSLVVGAMSAFLGHVAAITVPTWFGYSDTTTAGMIAVAAGMLFGLSVLLAPRHGLLSKLVHQTMLRLRIIREDMLGLLYRLEEMQAAGARPVVLCEAVGAGPMLGRLAMRGLLRSGRVAEQEGHLHITPAGRDEARQLVRSHRLWESYLQKNVGLDAAHVHGPADRVEHFAAELQDRVARDLAQAERDPHGQPIPPA